MNNPYIRRRQQSTGGMNATACIRCGYFWSFNSGAPQNFSVITKYCPTCVTHLPQLGDAA